jgi:hypothetical protein
MVVNIGDIIMTQAGGPYKVINISDKGLVTYRTKNGIGMTIMQFVLSVKESAK